MASLAIKIGTVGPDPKSQDGDLMDVFNKGRIERAHLGMICNVIKEGFNSDGLRPKDCMADFYQKTRYTYKNSVVSTTEYKRVNKITGEEKTFSHVPEFKCPEHGIWTNLLEMNVQIGNKITNKFECPADQKIWWRTGEYIHLPLWLRARKKHHRHRIFGSNKKEFWYGGRTDLSSACCDIIFPEVEARGKGLRADCQHATFGKADLKSYLCVTCDDFDDATWKEMMKPVLDLTDPDKPIKIKDHQCYSIWEKDIVGLSAGLIKDIKDRSKTIDLSKAPEQIRANIVKTKV